MIRVIIIIIINVSVSIVSVRLSWKILVTKSFYSLYSAVIVIRSDIVVTLHCHASHSPSQLVSRGSDVTLNSDTLAAPPSHVRKQAGRVIARVKPLCVSISMPRTL